MIYPVFGASISQYDSRAVDGWLRYPNDFEWVPTVGTKYVVRLRPYPDHTQAARNALTASDHPQVTKYILES